MKQYRITSDDIAPANEQDDCVLPSDDPAHEIKRLQFLGGLGGEQRLAEYRNSRRTVENITHTAAEMPALCVNRTSVLVHLNGLNYGLVYPT